MEDSSNGTGAGSNGHSSNGQGNGALANGHGLKSSDGNGTGANGNVPGSITPDSRVNLKAGQPLALPTELGSHPHLVNLSFSLAELVLTGSLCVLGLLSSKLAE